jgi:hypothetical protein
LDADIEVEMKVQELHSRWPSGSCLELAQLPLTHGRIEALLGAKLSTGTEEGLGAWSGIGLLTDSGYAIELVAYDAQPIGFTLRVDQAADVEAVLGEVLEQFDLKREDLTWVNLAALDRP